MNYSERLKMMWSLWEDAGKPGIGRACYFVLNISNLFLIEASASFAVRGMPWLYLRLTP